MPKFSDLFANRTVLADGAMGTVLYARGITINRCYDELNLTDPRLILSITVNDRGFLLIEQE